MAAYASSSVMTPNATIRVAPTLAAPVRSTPRKECAEREDEVGAGEDEGGGQGDASSATRARHSAHATPCSSSRGACSPSPGILISSRNSDPRAGVLAEHAEHRARDRDGVLLLDAAHRHAQVRRFHHDRDAERTRPSRAASRRSGSSGAPGSAGGARRSRRGAGSCSGRDATLRNVRDVALAEERQQVMLAEAVEVDVLDDHHLVIIDGEQRVVEDRVDVRRVAARQEPQRLLDPLRACRAALRATGLRRARRGAAG